MEIISCGFQEELRDSIFLVLEPMHMHRMLLHIVFILKGR